MKDFEKEVKERLKEALKNAIPEFRTHFALTYEDGTVRECDAEKWFLIGIDRKNKAHILWGRAILIGGQEIVEDAIFLIALMMLEAENLGRRLCDAVPGMDEGGLLKCVECAMQRIREKEAADNDKNHD